MNQCEFCKEINEAQADGVIKEHFENGRVICSDGVWDLMPTVGCFTEGYTLLVTHAHRDSLYHCTKREKDLFQLFTELLKDLYKKAYGTGYFMFEHGVVDPAIQAPNSVNHVHLHFLPLREGYAGVEKLLADDYSFKEYVFDDMTALDRVIEENQIKAYLLYSFDESYHLVDISVNTLPSQFLRTVTYQIETGNGDEGWNWRKHSFADNMKITYDTLKQTLDDMTSGRFSERVENYEKESNWIHDLSFIERLVPGPFGKNNFLDVACGTGVIGENALKKGWHVTAVDCCKEMLDEVDGSINKVLAVAEELPFEDGSFDAVVCRQGLQYMDMPVALREMARVSSGKIILLHATVDQRDVVFWQSVFNALGYVGKSIIGSYEIQGMISDGIEDASIGEDITLYSSEKLEIPEVLCEKIGEVIAENPESVARSAISYDRSHRILSYTLEWHVIIVEKLK